MLFMPGTRHGCCELALSAKSSEASREHNCNVIQITGFLCGLLTVRHSRRRVVNGSERPHHPLHVNIR